MAAGARETVDPPGLGPGNTGFDSRAPDIWAARHRCAGLLGRQPVRSSTLLRSTSCPSTSGGGRSSRRGPRGTGTALIWRPQQVQLLPTGLIPKPIPPCPRSSAERARRSERRGRWFDSSRGRTVAHQRIWPDARVVRERSATPRTRVRFPVRPPTPSTVDDRLFGNPGAADPP